MSRQQIKKMLADNQECQTNLPYFKKDRLIRSFALKHDQKPYMQYQGRTKLRGPFNLKYRKVGRKKRPIYEMQQAILKTFLAATLQRRGEVQLLGYFWRVIPSVAKHSAATCASSPCRPKEILTAGTEITFQIRSFMWKNFHVDDQPSWKKYVIHI